MRGVIMNIHSHKPPYPTKSVNEVLPVVLSDQQIAFAQWIAGALQGGLGYTLRLFMSSSSKAEKTTYAASKKKRIGKPVAVVDAFENRMKYLAQAIPATGQTLIIVPEVWMVKRITKVLSASKRTVHPYHTDLSALQQRETWYTVANTPNAIVVGTQKAVFLPFSNLSLIALEEEQFTTHKLWDQYPRLHNSIAARQLADIHHAQLAYLASFPSVALRYRVDHKGIQGKVDKLITPTIDVVEVAIEDRRSKRLLPNDFMRKLNAWNRKRETILILYNQLERYEGKRRRAGTQTIEKIFESYPALKKQLLRIDTRSKADLAKLSTKRIVMGTSAVLAPIQDMQFDHVVWLFPERALSYPDYRTVERSVVLLARLQQHARKEKPVIVVTKNPIVIRQQLGQDIQQYYDSTLKERKRYLYPPFANVVRLSVTAKTEEIAHKRAILLREEIEARAHSKKGIIVRGPFEDLAPKGKSDQPELHLLLQGPLEALVSLYAGLPVDAVDIEPQRIL